MQHAAQPPLQAISTRRALPDRNVNAASLDDAYVTFILYCNPGVPLDTDTAALREAFRTPPKSGGKVFSTFTLFELIKKLEIKELKTWAELALRLGVEPPDQEKGQSSQKIQQYAVRLKRWMHSMHVDAFFEYLIGRPSPYWTEIPSEHISVSELERDGVAAEDDMALRALLPQIKPRRGRRKPDDEEASKSPQPDDYLAGGQSNTGEPWTAQPDGRGSVFLFPPVPDVSRLNPSVPAAAWSNDIVQTPLTAYPIPQSAITPSTRNAFWADEPKSAITPPKSRTASRRHGAKVVSSAWRSGGIGASGKARGRPPINRAANSDGPFSAFPTSDTPAFRFPSPTADGSASLPTTDTVPNALPTAPPIPPLPVLPQPQAQVQPPPAQNLSYASLPPDPAPTRPAKKRLLSLQVPERKGGEVRLATPPPPEPAPPPVIIVIDGQPTVHHTHPATQPLDARHASTLYPRSQSPGTSDSGSLSTNTTTGPTAQEPFPFSQDPTDRTNKDDLEVHFMSHILTANWFDAKGNPIPACGIDEAWAFAQRVIENLLKTAATKEAFLINLAALAGGKILMNKGSLRITRLEELADRTRYSCAWQLRFGDIIGDWSMEETVLHSAWKKADRKEGEGGSGAGSGTSSSAGPTTSAWEERYKEVAITLQERDKEIALLKAKILETVRGK